MFETKYSQIKFKNVLFITPADAAHVRERFLTVLYRAHVSAGLIPTAPAPFKNHSLIYLRWKCHTWAAQCLQMRKNWGPHPSWRLTRSIHGGRHRACEIWSTDKLYVSRQRRLVDGEHRCPQTTKCSYEGESTENLKYLRWIYIALLRFSFDSPSYHAHQWKQTEPLKTTQQWSRQPTHICV